LFRQTWKVLTTPSGRQLWAHTASGRRTSGKDSISSQSHWITPQTHDDRERGNTEADHHYSPHDLSNMALLSPWPTPNQADDNNSRATDPQAYSTKRIAGGYSNLATTAQALAAWPTPVAGTPAQKGIQRSGEHGQQQENGGAGWIVGNTERPGLQEQRRLGGIPRGQDGTNARETVERAGAPTNGFWRDAEWLPCIDGKARPVEPGTFPLAHGATARVGRLRAYGNAVCAEQAAEFVRAYMTANFIEQEVEAAA